MTQDMVLWYLELFEELDIQVWIDGGWGIDALLGEQTRPHDDIDVMLPSADSSVLVEALLRRGFRKVPTADECERNFVLGHPDRGRIDFHVFEFVPGRGAVYRPREDDWNISTDELAAEGSISGRKVRCLSPDYHVRSHAGYELQDSDVRDMAALHARFGVVLRNDQIS